jgi:hypothetical protein
MWTHRENNMKITASNLIRWAGPSAAAAGILFIVIQIIHPTDILTSVTTSQWAIVHYVGVAMCLLGMFGITGLYARQVEASGWLGLAGYLLLSLFYAFTMAFQFVEAFFSPLLAIEAPRFVEGFLGIVTGHASEANLGPLPVVYSLTGFVGYVLGGLLFGIATLRASILPRWAAGLLVFAGVSVLAGPLLGHPLDRILAVPMGVALAGLGFGLWSERREQVSEPLSGGEHRQVHQTGAA